MGRQFPVVFLLIQHFLGVFARDWLDLASWPHLYVIFRLIWYSLFYNWKHYAKLLMEFTLYLEPQFVQLKKTKQNRVKTNEKNKCWRSKIKRGILALWFENMRKSYYHHTTRNQIQINTIRKDHTNSIRKKNSK